MNKIKEAWNSMGDVTQALVTVVLANVGFFGGIYVLKAIFG